MLSVVEFYNLSANTYLFFRRVQRAAAHRQRLPYTSYQIDGLCLLCKSTQTHLLQMRRGYDEGRWHRVRPARAKRGRQRTDNPVDLHCSQFYYLASRSVRCDHGEDHTAGLGCDGELARWHEASGRFLNGGKISLETVGKAWHTGIPPPARTPSCAPRRPRARARPGPRARRVPPPGGRPRAQCTHPAPPPPPRGRGCAQDTGGRQNRDRKTDLTDRQTGISDGAPSTEDTPRGTLV